MNEIHFESIDSTNTYAKTHGNEFPADQITCISADEQTAGHGRFNRPWAPLKELISIPPFFSTLQKKQNI